MFPIIKLVWNNKLILRVYTTTTTNATTTNNNIASGFVSFLTFDRTSWHIATLLAMA